jgi:CBS domain-containing protein
MLKAYEVMTHALATCPPDASVAEVAAIMRDRDIGDVLVVDDNKLCGIVTDRDLALQALTSRDNAQETPVRKYMTTHVVTGEATWNLEKVAQIMAKHRIRRLPIVEAGQLVGIVSLGDVAQHSARQEVVGKSLQAISTPASISVVNRTNGGRALIGFGLVSLATAMAWLTWNRSGQAFRKQLTKSDLYSTAQHALNAAREAVDEAASSEAARNARREVNNALAGLAAQLPTLEYKPAKAKRRLFA